MSHDSSLIALVDWNRGGHNETNLREYAAALVSLGCRVAVLSPYPLRFDSPFITSLYFAPRIRSATSASWKLSLELWRLQRKLSRLIKQAEHHFNQSCELVFFSCLYASESRHIRAAVAALSQSWSGLYLHVAGDARQYFPPTFKTLAVLDEQAEGLFFPDVTNAETATTLLAQKLRDFAGKRPLISLTGYLQPSKGMMPLIDLALRDGLPDYAFAFVGELCRANFSSDQLAKITAAEKQSPNSLFHFHRLPDEASYNAVIQTSDILYAAYIDFPHSSNTLTKAAVFEKPVIVSRGHLMERRTRDFRLGEVVTQNDTVSIVQAIHRISADHPQWLAQQQPRWKEYREAHSQTALRQSFRQLLEVYGIR
jgi:hypothetical protein